MNTTPAKFAVAVIVLRYNEELNNFAAGAEGGWECILVARKDDHSRWSLPGGKVDSGEASPLAAARELREETGIDINMIGEGEPASVFWRLTPQETVLDSGGYFTTFYLLDTTGMELPETFEVADHEAPVRWGPLTELLKGPYGKENRERLQKLGVM